MDRVKLRYLPVILPIILLLLYPQGLQAQTTPPASSQDKNRADVKKLEQTLIEERQKLEKPASKAPASKEFSIKLVPVVYRNLSKDEKRALQGRVEYERDKARAKMPILDGGYFHEVINKDVLIAQENFSSNQKVRTLHDVVARALEVSLEVKLAKEKSKTAKWRARKAFRNLWSEIGFEFTYKNGELSGSAQTGDAFKSNMQRINFKQPVYHGGNLWNTYREELSNSKAGREDLGKAHSKLVLDVVEAYMNYAKAQSLYHVTGELAGKMELYWKQNEEKKKADAVSEIEYLNTDSLIGEIRAELHKAYQELALAQLDLMKFVNLPKDTRLEVESVDALREKIIGTPSAGSSGISVAVSIENPEQMSVEVNELMDQAYINRPDLRLEEFKLMANRYKTKAAYGKFLPQADFIIEIGELAEAFKQIDKTPPYHSEWKIGMEVSQNFLGNTAKYSYDTTRTAPNVTEFESANGTRIKTNKFTFALLDALQQFVDVGEAKSQMLEQMVELQEKENEVIKEVKEAYYGCYKALIQLDSSIKKLAHKERVAKLKGYQLEKNQIQLSEYLQAEKDVVDARGQYAEAVGDYYKMRISLNRSIGEKDLLRMSVLPLARKETS
ncbi:MAG: TolC family protein [Candidatus Omnitrophica bacterium]|nr:TolC family protein [Candidatus Omnitrophota bacterium]